jgi:chorismate mutase
MMRTSYTRSHFPQGNGIASIGVSHPSRNIKCRYINKIQPKECGARCHAAVKDSSDSLSLGNIRRSLILMEDTIIFGLVERSQFALNAAVYQPGEIQMYSRDGKQLSLLEYLLLETEHVHGKIRRYTNPDENAFFPEYLPPLILPPLSYPDVLWGPAASVNVNDHIMDMYQNHLLPGITTPGDDGNYGSSAMYDVMILQALSRRIHYGKFVAESKFRQQTEEYTNLIQRGDAEAIMDLLTDRAVELKVIERVKLKASTFGQDLNSDEKMLRLDPDAVGDLYDEWVMPLTKDVEVEYLLKRLAS